MKKKNDEITIRSSTAEYLTYVASVGDQADSVVTADFAVRRTCPIISDSSFSSNFICVCSALTAAL